MTGSSAVLVAEVRDPRGRWQALALIALAQAAANSTWFSVVAVTPSLEREWAISHAELGLMVVAVQLGFAGGTLVAAVVGLPDLIDARRLFVAGTALAALLNAALVLPGIDVSDAIVLRFALGVSMAAVYPVALKLVTEWFRVGRALAMGFLVGGLTLGTAAPHLIAGLGLAGALPWQHVMLGTSSLALGAAAAVMLGLSRGPFRTSSARIDLGWAFRSLRDPANRLAHLGYFGHVWELYGMWTWLPVFLATPPGGPLSASLAAIASFVIIATGAAGAVAGGLMADRYGRTATAITAMVVSGTSAVVTGVLFGAAPAAVVAVAVVWGVSVVADSSQFSAGIAELTTDERVGSAVTLQHALGYLLGALSIQLVPLVEDLGGWAAAFSMLALGPLVGVIALARLRIRPEAMRLAHGRR